MLWAAAAWAAPGQAARAEDELLAAAKQLVDGHAAELRELAAWCDEQKLVAEAEKTRTWLAPRDPNKMYVAVLPEQLGPPPMPETARPEAVEWNRRLWRLRRRQASRLFDLARRAAAARRASLALDLALRTAREDPDHAGVRRLMGYQEYHGRWCTPFGARKLRSGQVWHKRFGWLPKSHVRRYEEGRRYHKGRWITAAEDARLHRDIRSGWDIETEHYTVRTNHGIEAGVELGTQLEQLYRIWQQLFVRYYATESQVIALFDARSRSRATKAQRFNVVFFRDREDYNRSLRPAMPNIGMSIGVYRDSTGRAYFFAGEGYEQRTLHHEATHQLFHQSRPVARDVAQKANFWIIEGIAMFMESLREENGYHTLGGFDDERMVAARYRLLHDDFHVPLSEFCGYGMQRIQADRRIATLYSEAAGLTHFLVFYDGGRYRDALIAYLSAVYSGRDDPATLSRLTGVPYATLDRQYRDFMKSGPRQQSPEPE